MSEKQTVTWTAGQRAVTANSYNGGVPAAEDVERAERLLAAIFQAMEGAL